MLGIAANKIGLGAEALSYLGEAEKLMVPDRKTLFRLHQELAESFRMKGEPDFRLQELEECMRYAEEKDVNTLTYQMGKCYLQLRQFDKAREYLSRFLDAIISANSTTTAYLCFIVFVLKTAHKDNPNYSICIVPLA